MKKFCFIILLAISLNGFSQKNEFLMLPGITTYHFFSDQSAVFQYKYERRIGKSISLQTGLRYHSEISHTTYDGISKWVQSVFNSYKLDASLLFIPIDRERFKLKTGIGIDAGISNYYWAGKGLTRSELAFDENNKMVYKDFTYIQHDIDKITDLGIHFIFQGNYYFSNNLFVTAQILYNYVFDQEVANKEYSKTLFRSSPICLSAGVGYCF
jgi:hypothetical protein